MRCWRCKSEMPEGLKYCGNCGVHMNRAVHMFQWLFSKKGLPVLIVILALIIGAAAWFIIPKLRMPTIEFDLDMGWYTPDDGNIVYHDDNKSYGYVNNMILVFFTKDATDEQITEVINSVDGTLRGILPGVRQYQIEVAARTEEELEALRKQLMEFDVVKNAVIDYVATAEGETASIPNDPWNDPSGSGFSNAWDEENPDGTNWWIEASHILSAWGYQDQYSRIPVGVVDSGFDPNHEDLNIQILNPEHNNAGEHGTHVAGIIAATGNNGLGITGVVQNADVYCVDCAPTDEQSAKGISVSSMYASIDRCIMNGCRVVNLSRGLVFNSREQNEPAAERTSRSALENLIMMMDSYDEEFIIVKSAGNAAVESRYSGYYAAITEDLVREVLERMHTDGVKFEEEITVADVMNSMMVVGAVDYYRVDGQYQLAKFSNYGDLLTVCAPGCLILSTVPEGNAYEYLQGTSMATPIVTGVTALVWSVDPTMSAGEVKEIIVSTATEPVLPRTDGDHGTYYMIDAAAAVEKALNILAEKATEPTEPVESGSPDKYIPIFDRYIGELHYDIETSSLVTTTTGEQYYWDVGSVDLEAAPYVDSYMELLLEDTYQLELIYENDGEYYYTYTGSADLETLGMHDGMSRQMENCHLWIKVTESDYSITFQRWCSAQFDFIEVTPPANLPSDPSEPDTLVSRIETYESGNLTVEYNFYYNEDNRLVTIDTRYVGGDGNDVFEGIFFSYENGLLINYENTGTGECCNYTYDDEGRLIREEWYGTYTAACEYWYDEDGNSLGCTATYSDRVENQVYDYSIEDQILVTRTTEYYDGREPIVDSWIWKYNEDGVLLEETELFSETTTTTVRINRDYPNFVLREYDDTSGLTYYNLDIDVTLGNEYFNTYWSLYLKGCEITTDENGLITLMTDPMYDRVHYFTYG